MFLAACNIEKTDRINRVIIGCLIGITALMLNDFLLGQVLGVNASSLLWGKGEPG
ncbi:MAG: hypothetical protein H2069_08780 [Legionella sp.]|nr:hypothetical protein [Legionella sp.]